MTPCDAKLPDTLRYGLAILSILLCLSGCRTSLPVGETYEPCVLVTKEEASAAMNEPVRDAVAHDFYANVARDKNEIGSLVEKGVSWVKRCVYNGLQENTTGDFMEIAVYQFENQKQAMSFYEDQTKGPAVRKDLGENLPALKGLCDRSAQFGGPLSSSSGDYVLKGDLVLYIGVVPGLPSHSEALWGAAEHVLKQAVVRLK